MARADQVGDVADRLRGEAREALGFDREHAPIAEVRGADEVAAQLAVRRRVVVPQLEERLKRKRSHHMSSQSGKGRSIAGRFVRGRWIGYP
jgi:hypothetical protein